MRRGCVRALFVLWRASTIGVGTVSLVDAFSGQCYGRRSVPLTTRLFSSTTSPSVAVMSSASSSTVPNDDDHVRGVVVDAATTEAIAFVVAPLDASVIAVATRCLTRITRSDDDGDDDVTAASLARRAVSVARLVRRAAEGRDDDAGRVVKRARRDAWERTLAFARRVREDDVAACAAFVATAASPPSAGARAAAGALRASVAETSSGSESAYRALRACVARPDVFDPTTLARLAAAFETDAADRPELARAIAAATEHHLATADDDEDEGAARARVAGALALAARSRPWAASPVVPAVEAATARGLVEAAREVVISAHGIVPAEARRAARTAIDASIAGGRFREADVSATKLYEVGGRARFVRARYEHARNTIDGLVRKRVLPVVETQVRRVDQAVERVCEDEERYREVTKEDGDEDGDLLATASRDVRRYAIRRLEEAGEIDEVLRLAALWNLDHEHDPVAVEKAASERRRAYLQLEDLGVDVLPDLVSDPSKLRAAFAALVCDDERLFGLDAEWDDGNNNDDDDDDTASPISVLQLANSRRVALLIDVPALSSTDEGSAALADTVGRLLDRDDVAIAGFSCRQDARRLRRADWIASTRAVVDVQRFVPLPPGRRRRERLGLSRSCETVLGKRLDKSEQCSRWSARPLSERQRAYATLDALVCVELYERLGIAAAKGDDDDES